MGMLIWEFINIQQVIALDVSRKWYEIGAPLIEKAGMAHKVDFREGPAMESINALLRDVSVFYTGLCSRSPMQNGEI